MIRAIVAGWFAVVLAGGFPLVQVQEVPDPVRPDDFVLVKTIEVSGGPGWTDADLDVLVDQEFWFEASGMICLQAGNPEADCGPDGLKIRLMQQPIPEQNLGCLVGRVLQHVEVIEDAETKEKTVREHGVAFFIGRIGSAKIPADGRLFLGPNEDVTGDNSGTFVVRIYRRG